MTTSDPDERAHRRYVRETAREIARELRRIQAADLSEAVTPPAYRPMSPDLLTGGGRQCVHGVPEGAYLRPSTGTPACPLCRLAYLDEQ